MEKYGFVYIWYDCARKMFYVGSHWGYEDDGYICSSNWMRHSYKRRPQDFKKPDGSLNRKILKRIYTNRKDLLKEEQHWLNMIKPEEMAIRNSTTQKRKNVRYYNISKIAQNTWHYDDEKRKTIGQKVSIAKKGKSLPCTPEKATAISKAKKAKFAERGGMSEEHKAALCGPRDFKHTNEWKIENGKRTKAFWESEAGQELKEKRASEPGHSLGKPSPLRGRKLDLSEEQLETIKERVSKPYIITFIDGHTEEIHGLKAYSIANNIPYVTLYKASQNRTAIKKYNILAITQTNSLT